MSCKRQFGVLQEAIRCLARGNSVLARGNSVLARGNLVSCSTPSVFLPQFGFLNTSAFKASMSAFISISTLSSFVFKVAFCAFKSLISLTKACVAEMFNVESAS